MHAIIANSRLPGSDADNLAFTAILAEADPGVCDTDAEAVLQTFLGALSQPGRAALFTTLRRMAANLAMPPRLRSDLAALAEDVAALVAGSADN